MVCASALEVVRDDQIEVVLFRFDPFSSRCDPLRLGLQPFLLGLDPRLVYSSWCIHASHVGRPQIELRIEAVHVALCYDI